MQSYSEKQFVENIRMLNLFEGLTFNIYILKDLVGSLDFYLSIKTDQSQQ